MSEALAPTSRHKFTYQGRTIYEWDQTLTEVNVYIQVPEGVKGKQLQVDIKNSHLTVGIKPNPPYLDGELAGRVNTSETYWTLEGGTLSVQLCKAEAGEPWSSAIVGHAVDALATEQDTKRMMLERFQQEHPGFDFSGAEFTGQAPDPRTFLRNLDSDL